MSDSTQLVRREGRALERSEVERRRVIVARLRRLESQLTAVAIVQVLRKETPPIVVSVRTVEGDFVAVRADTHRYLTTKNVDARFEVGEALAPHEPIARKATQRALTVNGGDGAKWARIAIRATEARTQLLQDIGLIDREIGTLFIDDGQRARIEFRPARSFRSYSIP